MFRNLWIMHVDSRFVTLKQRHNGEQIFFFSKILHKVKYSCVSVAHSVGHCGNVTEISSQGVYYSVSESKLIVWPFNGTLLCAAHIHIRAQSSVAERVFISYWNMIFPEFTKNWHILYIWHHEFLPGNFTGYCQYVFLPPPTHFPIIPGKIPNSREAFLLKDSLRSGWISCQTHPWPKCVAASRTEGSRLPQAADIFTYPHAET